MLEDPRWNGISAIVALITLVSGGIGGIISLFIPQQTQQILGGLFSAFLIGVGMSLGISLYLSPAATTSPTLNTNIPIAIDSTKDWQSTGVMIEQGDTIQVRVVGGRWTHARTTLPVIEREKLPDYYQGVEIFVNNGYETMGDGDKVSFCSDFGQLNCPVPTAKMGALVARVGLLEPFLIGNTKTFVAPDTGVLYLRINDGEKEGLKNLQDNSGILAVEITINK